MYHIKTIQTRLAGAVFFALSALFFQVAKAERQPAASLPQKQEAVSILATEAASPSLTNFTAIIKSDYNVKLVVDEPKPNTVYTWKTGDGKEFSGTSAACYYKEPGKYKVTLIASVGGSLVSSTKDIIVGSYTERATPEGIAPANPPLKPTPNPNDSTGGGGGASGINIAPSQGTSVVTDDISVYPNPANDYTTFDYHAEKSGSLKVSVFDITGKQVIDNRYEVMPGMNHIKIETSVLGKGYYLVKAANCEDLMTGRFTR